MHDRSKRRKSPRIAFVMGDPAGISAELAAKLLADKSNSRASVVAGDRRSPGLAEGEQIAGVNTNIQVVAEPLIAGEVGEPLFYDLRNLRSQRCRRRGRRPRLAALAVMSNFRKGLELARDGHGRRRVLHAVQQAGDAAGAQSGYDDEIAFRADVLGLKTPASEFNVLGRIWNARVTSHIPLQGRRCNTVR